LLIFNSDNPQNGTIPIKPFKNVTLARVVETFEM
jgi:hypothetical protein